MKHEAIENASTDSLHAELDRQILELLRKMTPEKKRQALLHIEKNYTQNSSAGK